jgi:hypothetical protein
VIPAVPAEHVARREEDLGIAMTTGPDKEVELRLLDRFDYGAMRD